MEFPVAGVRLTSRLSRQQVTQVTRVSVAIFGALGLVPLELILPPVIAYFDHQFTTSVLLSLYFMGYALGLTLSLRSYWVKDRAFFSRTKFGRKCSKVIRWARRNRYRSRWPFVAKLGYYSALVVLSACPFVIKFAIGMSIFHLDWKSGMAICIGVTFRSFLIVYLGTDLFRLIFS